MGQWIAGIAVVGLLLCAVAWLQARERVGSQELQVVCLDGVEYWYASKGYGKVLAVKYNQAGTVSTCK